MLVEGENCVNFWYLVFRILAFHEKNFFLYFRNVAMGYFLNEEKTKEDFYEEDGFRWFRTGIKLFSQIIFEKYFYLH